jgi:exopolysaccharide biosynthesis polyprenyl glycosylphosphotransferase
MSSMSLPVRGEPSRRGSAVRRPQLVVVRAMNRRGIRLLHVADLVLVYLLLFMITGSMIVLRPGFNAAAHLPRYAWSYAIVALIHLAVFSFGGLYDRERRLVIRPSSSRLVTLVWLASLLVGLASWLLGEFLIPRSVLIIYGLIGPIGLWLNRRLARALRNRTEGPARILLVGPVEAADRAREHLTGVPAVTVVGRTGQVDRLEQRVAEAGATDVLLLDGDALAQVYADSLSRLEQQGVETLKLVRPYDSLLGLRTVGEIGGMPVVSLSAHVLSRSQQRTKRWMDLLVLLLTAPITVPLISITALVVAVRAGRPLLFVQHRVGLHGVAFPMFKFRTMRPDAEPADRPLQAAVDDPRVIRGLGWLRRTRLDELPQLVNVLRGEMTIVGPRPERPEEMADYERLIPGYRRRHQIEPGITGLAQVYGHYHTHPEFKLGHDLQYLANWSPVLDLQIMARTAWVIVARRL